MLYMTFEEAKTIGEELIKYAYEIENNQKIKPIER